MVPGLIAKAMTPPDGYAPYGEHLRCEDHPERPMGHDGCEGAGELRAVPSGAMTREPVDTWRIAIATRLEEMADGITENDARRLAAEIRRQWSDLSGGQLP